MNLTPKQVLVDGRLVGYAKTTLGAAELAQRHGVAITPHDAFDRSRYIGEGPHAFYVARKAGDYRGRP